MENLKELVQFPLEEWHGGKVRHIVRDKVILLERGQVFEIEGTKFFTFGGASSHDVRVEYWTGIPRIFKGTKRGQLTEDFLFES